ncbi:MAG: glycine--tRNA ligase subunit beta [Thermotogae bacterium]|nr:glycine--tRNA ligase subunit beta [Thermotogota bacterium]
MKWLLVELGCEEIPAFVQEGAAEYLLEFLRKRLSERGFEVGEGRHFATPLRLAALLEVSPKSAVVERERVGPPLKVAYDSEGRPTEALKKFVQSVGASLDDVYIKEKGKGRYVAVKVKSGGENVGDVIGEILADYVRTVPLPKRMRWDDSSLTFIRPIRWLVVLFGDEVLPVSLGRLKADRTTYSGRLPIRRRITLERAEDYESALEGADVIPDFRRRLARVKEEVARFFNPDPERYEDYDTDLPSLLYEITGLVEKGYAVYGRYSRDFLKELYPEVIMAAMTAHQRYVPHLEDDGLRPGFVAFSNNPKGLNLHLKGYENVLRARLDDALFYKREDLKRPLSYYVENLKNITWIRGLGTLYDRMERVRNMARRMPKPEGLNGEILEFVATHYLFDTATSMIRDGKEFTKLEGKIGYYYARDKLAEEWGDPERADRWAVGIYEARLPKGRRFPKTLEGTAVAIADSLNTVDGLLQIDYRWTSSKDPLGIRTNVRRFLALLLSAEAGYIFGRYDLETFLSLTHTYSAKERVWKELVEEMLPNALAWVQEVFSYPFYPSEPANVRKTYRGDNVFLAALRARAYEEVVRGEARERFETILKRLRRIVNSSAKRFLKEEEPGLSRRYERRLEEVIGEIERAVPEGKDRILSAPPEELLDAHVRYFRSLLTLHDALDEFFTHVPVMVEDEADRKRRLSLLGRALKLIDEVIPGA